jgi:hypothetical protein
MSDDKTIRLHDKITELRQNLSDAHDQIAKATYKYGYVLAMLGIPADLPLEEVKKQVAQKITK